MCLFLFALMALGDWLRSLAALKNRLPDDLLVLPSHGEPFHGVTLRLEDGTATAGGPGMVAVDAARRVRDAAGWAWGLRLPGLELPPAAGEAQRAQALEALALWSGS